jgi:hypothetical protein
VKELFDTDVDDRLHSEAQNKLRQIVKALPEDTPSLHWRSSLNERILALGPMKKRLSAFAITVRTLAGASVACLVCLGVFMWQSRNSEVGPQKTESGPGLASALINEHRDSVESGEITGAGISGTPEANNLVESTQDSDLDAL